jgi:HEPN domain-containing protein
MADSKDYRRWIEYAENDFRAALQVKDTIASSAAFLFQASIEKYLKAVLYKRQANVPKVHDIDALLELVQPNLPETSREQQAAKLLGVIFNISRYPDDLLDMGLEETSSVSEAASLLREMARAELGLEGVLP